MSRVIVIGGSDQGRQVLDAIVARAFHTAVGVLDRALPRDHLVAGVPVLGTDDDLARAPAEVGADHFVVAIGDNATRWRGAGGCRGRPRRTWRRRRSCTRRR